MSKLEDLEKRLREYTEDVQEKAILKIIQDSDSFLVDLNTAQLMKGLDVDGILIGPPYASPSYADFKLFLNPLGVVDLFLTGAFQRSIFIKASQFPVLFDAGDSKKDDLLNKYGNILGVGEDGKKMEVEHIKEQVQEYYRAIF